ncbi:SDR family NAD(P)-dependent oxidoreductase [Dinoroseobacter sp. S124A]|uniref:SDR family NAD(P)-dependent oxidoreductase n=1 Tax=Dinoroseobacter sp. S124A TaxID=3415128 RepID=UPI003C7E484A
MAYDLQDKIALVTGASRGLGHAVAEALAARGAHVIALARTVGGLEELDDRIQAQGGQATLAPIDLTKDDAVAGICRAIFDRWGRIDLLVHTAVHAPALSPVDHADPKDYAKTFATNVEGTQRVIRMVAPLLHAAPEGRAVFCTDPRAGEKFFGLYGASKAAEAALVASWAAETARTGLRVASFTPEPMPTATRARFFPGEDRAALSTPADQAKRLLALLDAE